MQHLSSDEIFEYLKGRLGPETAATIGRHLEECTACRAELEAVTKTADWLNSWDDEEVPAASLERVKAAVAGSTPIAPLPPPDNRRTGSRTGRWLPRLGAAAAAAVVVLAVQAFLWNPFSATVNVQGVLALTPPALAMPAGQVVPDTVLVITIHADGAVSVPEIEGELTIEELTRRLPGQVAPGTWRTILLLGSDPDNPVSVRLDRFEPLKEALGISGLRVGSGVMGVAPFFWSVSRPVWNIRRTFPFAAGDSLGWSVLAPAGGWPENAFPGRAWNLSAPWFAPNLSAGFAESLMSEYAALNEGNGVTAAITADGEVIFSRGVSEMNRAGQQLRALIELIPDLQLKILVPEGMSERARALERVARDQGITAIEIVTVKR